MALVCQLSKIMKRYFGDSLRGAVADICKKTTLNRAQVTPLMNNSAKFISLDVIEQICLYLNRVHAIPWPELPGILFAFEATGFWSMFDKSHVHISVGVRRDEKTDEYRSVNVYDAYLLATCNTEWFKLGHERLSLWDQLLVPSCSPGKDSQAAFANAHAVYEDFRSRAGGTDRSLVSIGSMKSNPLSECIVARAFATNAFEKQRNVSDPKQRHVPFFFCYRPQDPHPDSCFGGLHLAHSQRDCQPGIHCETESGWKCCPTTPDGVHDAAMIFYCYRPHQKTVEVLLAGFSGRATASLANDLATCARQIWPPQYQQPDLKIGAYIIRYEFDAARAERFNSRELVDTPTVRQIIAMPESAIARRIAARETVAAAVSAAAPATLPVPVAVPAAGIGAARTKSTPRKPR